MTVKVLIVDDSATSVSLLSGILATDPGIEVVGVARDGDQAVEQVKRLRPDIVTMDIVMPGMGGYDAIETIMSECPTPIIVVSGALDIDEVQMSMQALRLGAVATLQKPMGPGSRNFVQESRRLIGTVKGLADTKVIRRRFVARAQTSVAPHKLGCRPIGIVAIGASTGGPAAVRELLAELSPDFPVPILVVQHISPGFEPGFARWLGESLAHRVVLAKHGAGLEPGTVYVAPEGYHLGVADQRTIALSGVNPLNGFRPSVTCLYRSICAAFGADCAGVLLSGMGSDGAVGLKELHDRGALTAVQSEESCVVFGMPGAAVVAGAASYVLDPRGIARLLAESVAGRKVARD